jgi:hypothetical protein
MWCGVLRQSYDLNRGRAPPSPMRGESTLRVRKRNAIQLPLTVETRDTRGLHVRIVFVQCRLQCRLYSYCRRGSRGAPHRAQRT